MTLGRRGLTALALATLVVLAGCGGNVAVDGGGEGEDTTSETLTPAPVPTETPVRTGTATPTPMPTATASAPGGALIVPGLSARGVTDSFRVADGHRQALTDGSYRVVTTVTYTWSNGSSLYDRHETLRVGSDGTTYRYTARTNVSEAYPIVPFTPRLGLWFDGETATFRYLREGAVRYERTPATGTGPLTDLSGHDRLAGLLANTDVRLVGRDIEGNYRVGGTRFSSRSVLRVPAPFAAPRNATLSLVVTPDGLVARHRLSYVATFDGERVRVTRERRFERAPEVESPSWLATARNATSGATETSGAEARRAVEEE